MLEIFTCWLLLVRIWATENWIFWLRKWLIRHSTFLSLSLYYFLPQVLYIFCLILPLFLLFKVWNYELSSIFRWAYHLGSKLHLGSRLILTIGITATQLQEISYSSSLTYPTSNSVKILLSYVSHLNSLPQSHSYHFVFKYPLKVSFSILFFLHIKVFNEMSQWYFSFQYLLFSHIVI